MKNIKLFSIDMLIIILSGLLIGLSIGLFCPQISIQFKTLYNNIYIKLHPETQMDTRTIIINRVTKDSINNPQNDIFENTEKKESSLIIFLKKIFHKKDKTKEITIIDYHDE